MKQEDREAVCERRNWDSERVLEIPASGSDETGRVLRGWGIRSGTEGDTAMGDDADDGARCFALAARSVRRLAVAESG